MAKYIYSRFFCEDPHFQNSNVISVNSLDEWYDTTFNIEEKQILKNKNIWMKLDVEAAEIEVLNGGINMIKELQPRICVENHNCLKTGIESEVRSLLTNSLFNYKEIITIPYHTISHSLYERKI